MYGIEESDWERFEHFYEDKKLNALAKKGHWGSRIRRWEKAIIKILLHLIALIIVVFG